MSRHLRLLHALCLLCSLLTASASGDDFSLLRLIFDVPRPTPGALPLDDPNTDFTEARPDAAWQDACHCASVACLVTPLVAHTSDRLTAPADLLEPPPDSPALSPVTPLRC